MNNLKWDFSTKEYCDCHIRKQQRENFTCWDNDENHVLEKKIRNFIT